MSSTSNMLMHSRPSHHPRVWTLMFGICYGALNMIRPWWSHWITVYSFWWTVRIMSVLISACLNAPCQTSSNPTRCFTVASSELKKQLADNVRRLSISTWEAYGTMSSSVPRAPTTQVRKHKLNIPSNRICPGDKAVRVYGATLWSNSMAQYHCNKCYRKPLNEIYISNYTVD